MSSRRPPRAADVSAASVDREPVVEVNRLEVPNMGLDGQRLVALLLDVLVALRVTGQVVDPGDLEPDEIRRVVSHSLRVRLREPDGDLGLEVEALHRCVLSPP